MSDDKCGLCGQFARGTPDGGRPAGTGTGVRDQVIDILMRSSGESVAVPRGALVDVVEELARAKSLETRMGELTAERRETNEEFRVEIQEKAMIVSALRQRGWVLSMNGKSHIVRKWFKRQQWSMVDATDPETCMTWRHRDGGTVTIDPAIDGSTALAWRLAKTIASIEKLPRTLVLFGWMCTRRDMERTS